MDSHHGVAATVGVMNKEPIKLSLVMMSQGSVTVSPMSWEHDAIPVRRIPGVWILGGGAPLVNVTVWGRSTPSVTREPGSVRVDREWRDRNVTSVHQAITDSPSVDVNAASPVISRVMCVTPTLDSVSAHP